MAVVAKKNKKGAVKKSKATPPDSKFISQAVRKSEKSKF
jgi:hypothetical protein